MRRIWSVAACFTTVMGAVGACSSDDTTSAGGTDGGAANDAPSAADTSPGVDGGGPSDANAGDGGDASEAGDAGHPVTGYTVLGEISYAFVKPYSLAVDSQDALYVSQQTDAEDTHTIYLTTRDYSVDNNPGQARILKFDSAGTYVGWIGAGNDNTYGLHATNSTATAVYSFGMGAFNMIRGMTFDPATGHLFVLDDWRVQELDNNNNFVTTHFTGYAPGGFGWQVGGGTATYAGPGIGGFQFPSCIRVHKGKLWIGNWYWNYSGWPNGGYNAVDVLDMTTGLGAGWLGGAFNSGTAQTTHGFFAASSPDGGSAAFYDDGGTTLTPQSSYLHSSSPGIFSSPRHFVWQNDKIYVVDDTSDPVLSVFDENGVMQPGKLEHLVGADEKPFAIALDKYGNIIISDMYTGSVRFFTQKLDANGEFTQAAEWQVDTPSVENISYPRIADFAWDSQDNLYVAATTKNKVYKIKLTY